VLADPAQLEQVLMNLVVNARDAMPKGGQLTIATSQTCWRKAEPSAPADLRPGKYVLLSVQDTGTGMDAEMQRHLFEPFFSTKGRRRGIGLGLSIVYAIVKQSHGDIEVDSEPGQGTTFRIYFPVAPQAVARAGR
jgi:signal transduction histidine kinase